MKKNYLLFVGMIALMFASCSDKIEADRDDKHVKPANSILILNEGKFGDNNASIALYDLDNNLLDKNYFNTMNGRDLGDTANDMIRYGTKIYVTVNMSGTIEVINANNGKSLQRIEMKSEGNSKGPNKLVAYEGKVYVTSFDDTVTRIDTTSLKADGSVSVGRTPEGICALNGKLYVANSGGMDYEGGNQDNSISVIDVASFKHENTIEVGKNPYQLFPDSKGNIYVSTRPVFSDDWETIITQASLKVLDPKTGDATTIENILPSKFTIVDDVAYIVIDDYSQPIVTTYACKNSVVLKENIIPADFKMSTPYSISIDDEGNIYLTETDYKIPGNVHCFDKTGKHNYSVKQTGINPTTVLKY